MGLADDMRQHVVDTFFGATPPEGIRRLFAPDRAFQAALIYEHWQFLQGFPRWVGSIIAGTPHLDVIQYEVDNLYGELIHDANAERGHYALVLEAGTEVGLSREEILRGPPGPKMARAIEDWYAIARERPWVETMAAVHGTEMLADQRLKERPGYRYPYQMGDEEFLRGAAYSPKGRRFLATTRADTEHAGHAAALVEKYATDAPTRSAVMTTFRRSMKDMELYMQALVDRADQWKERFGT